MRFQEFMEALRDNREFREEFAATPAEVLRRFGFDPDMIDLPENIDPDEIERKIRDRPARAEDIEAPSPEQVERLSADELWRDFLFLRLKEDAQFPAPAKPSSDAPSPTVVLITATGVIYGATVSAHSTVTVAGGGTGDMRSFAQVRTLRDLLRVDSGELTFGVTGPDGVRVSGLPDGVIKAFVKRLE